MPKTVLNLFRELALGKSEPCVELCRLFDRQTEEGGDMRAYSRLLANSVESIAAFLPSEASAKAGGSQSLPGAASFKAGSLGTFEIKGDNILLGKPFIFNKANIDRFDF